MVAQTVLTAWVAALPRPAAVSPRVVGDVFPGGYSAGASASLWLQARGWFSVRDLGTAASWERRRAVGAAGFFAGDAVFSGL